MEQSLQDLFLTVSNMSITASYVVLFVFILSVLWGLGILSLLVYSVVSYMLLKRNVSTAMLLKDNIFECENTRTPFARGIFWLFSLD